MNGKMRFFTNGLLLTAVGLTMRGVQLLFGAYISRTVGAEGIGLNTLVMTAFSFAVTFATSGVSLTVTRLTAAAIGEGRDEENGKILRGAAIYSLIFSLTASTVLFFAASIIGNNFLDDMRTVIPLQVLSFSLVPSAMSAVISGYFVGIKRVGFNAAVQVVGQVVRVGVTVLLLVRLGGLGVGVSVTALAIGVTLTELLCLAFGAVQLFIERRGRKKRRGADFKPVFKMAFPLAASAYIRSALLTLEHSLIPKRLVGRGDSRSEALASYGYLHGMALPLILYPLTPLTAFCGLLVPEFAETQASGNNDRMSRIATRALNTTLLYSILAAAFVFVFSEELGYTVYGSYEAGSYIAMLAPVIPIMYLDHVTDSILKGIGEHIYSMWVNIIDACLSVILVCILIPVMGIAGYAVVIIAMELFNFLLSFLRLRGRVRFSVSICESLLLPLLCAVISAYLSRELFVPMGSGASALWLIAEGLFAIASFTVSYIILRFVWQLTYGRRGRKVDENALLRQHEA